MLGFLTHSRFRFRDAPEFSEPKGPDMRFARSVSCLLVGNHLTMKLPRHAPEVFGQESLAPKLDSVLDFASRPPSIDSMPDQSWLFSSSIMRGWRFNGPWFSGVLGCVYFGLNVIQRTLPAEGVSFFHPNSFEFGVADFLNSLYGHKTFDGEVVWRAPVNWAVKTGLPVLAASYGVVPVTMGEPRFHCMFPITDQHIVNISFSFRQDASGFLEARDKVISRKEMWALIYDILDSLELTLSDESQAQLKAVKSQCDDYSLSKEFAPLKWPVTPGPAVKRPENNGGFLR